jgi:hypothetical protein
MPNTWHGALLYCCQLIVSTAAYLLPVCSCGHIVMPNGWHGDTYVLLSADLHDTSCKIVITTSVSLLANHPVNLSYPMGGV